MTTSPLSTPNVSVVLNDTSFQVNRDPTCLLFLSMASSTQNTTLDNQIKQHTHCVAYEIVFLPLHPYTCAPFLEERVIAVCLLILPARCHRWNASHNLLCCLRNRVSASSSRHVRSIVPGARHFSLPSGSTSRLSQMECRSCWKFPVDVISQEMIQVTRHTDVPQRNAPSRSKPTLFQMTTPALAERFYCSEVLFQPRFIGSEASGIYGTSFQIDLFGSVVLSGGTMHPYAS